MHEQTDIEREWLVKLSRGEESVFRELFDHYHPFVYSFALRMTESDPIAKDVVQDVFVKIWINRETLHTIDNLPAYLNRMTRNLVLNGMKRKAHEESQIGTVMPSFTSLDTARNELHLNEVVSKGKVTLVDFWASWCAPCRAENPNVVKAFNSFHPKGFEIISVSLDDNAQRWKEAIVKDGMPWYHVSGLKKWQEPVAVFFGINAVPDNFLLDAKGRVVARGLKGEALYKKIEEMTR